MYEKETELPGGISVEVGGAAGSTVVVSGSKGRTERTFKGLHGIKIEVAEREAGEDKAEGGKAGENKVKVVKVSADLDERKSRALVGAILAHIRNMAKGVTIGYVYKLRVIYSHFPITIKVEGDRIFVQNFLGEKTPRVAKILGDTKVDVKGPDITLAGTNKEDIGQTAANLETVTQIKKHSRKVFQDGIFIVEKDVEAGEPKDEKQAEKQGEKR